MNFCTTHQKKYMKVCPSCAKEPKALRIQYVADRVSHPGEMISLRARDGKTYVITYERVSP